MKNLKAEIQFAIGTGMTLLGVIGITTDSELLPGFMLGSGIMFLAFSITSYIDYAKNLRVNEEHDGHDSHQRIAEWS